MDGNKDEAQKCLKIAKEALDSGNKSRAQKFLIKARHLDPSLSIENLLSSAENSSSADNTTTTNQSKKAAEIASSSSSSPAPKPDAYTVDQIEIIKQIKKKKDFYDILGLERSSTVEDIRKAYRKLSLKVHPDKNKAPGAEEAFKAVSKSFQCLSNEESRKRYDLSGSDEPAVVRRQHPSHFHNGFNGFYDVDVDADEIFRNFFFGGMNQAATTPFGGFQFRTGGGHGVQGGSGNFNVRALLQILPVIVLLLLNFLPSSDPVYTFNRSYPYEHKVLTAKGAPFYVKSAKFEQEYPEHSSARIGLETRVEREYVGLLAQNCRLELQRYHWGFQNQKPHCDMLEKFQERDAT